MHCLPLLILCLVLVISIASGASRASRALPVVTVTDAHGQVKSIQTFLWVHRLAEVKDRVQMKQKIPKDRMILWYIPKDRDGYDTSPVYNIDDSYTFAEVEKIYTGGRRGSFGITYHR